MKVVNFLDYSGLRQKSTRNLELMLMRRTTASV